MIKKNTFFYFMLFAIVMIFSVFYFKSKMGILTPTEVYETINRSSQKECLVSTLNRVDVKITKNVLNEIDNQCNRKHGI